MTPAQLAFTILSEPDLSDALIKIRGDADPLGGVYIGTPDFDNTTDDDVAKLSPWIRITDLPGDEAEFSDDERFIEYPRVQVDFWIRKELLPEASDIESQIKHLMHESGWERTYRRSDIDGDLPRLAMITQYFQSLGVAV